ncbi:MAG: hypothetical protein QOJ64_1437 [Acidobacteriota bacterium]|jgi:hypothetical protein|nr:hypothetical protein [Acidobacteriota bacterium]
MTDATDNDGALVMSYIGHRSLESFKIYLHATQRGCRLADQLTKSVGLFLAFFSGLAGQPGEWELDSDLGKPVEKQQVML